MTVKLSTPAIEQSTYIVLVSFKDESGEPVAPKSCVWTLSDSENIVNSREDIVVSPLSNTIHIVLSGNDLAIDEGTSRTRYLLVEAVYDSATYGNDLNLREEFSFQLTDLKSLRASD